MVWRSSVSGVEVSSSDVVASESVSMLSVVSGATRNSPGTAMGFSAEAVNARATAGVGVLRRPGASRMGYPRPASGLGMRSASILRVMGVHRIEDVSLCFEFQIEVLLRDLVDVLGILSRRRRSSITNSARKLSKNSSRRWTC